MVVNSDATHFHEVKSEFLGWLLAQISDDEGI